jgi:hypothetical protein
MSITDDLFQVADDAGKVLLLIRDDSIQKPLSDMSKACEEAKRAWSGSNIGSWD